MSSTSRLLTPRVRFSLVRSFTLGALVGAATLAAACSGTPTAPGALSSERRVSTGGAGGTVSPLCADGSGICEVVVTAAGGSLAGPTDVTSDGTGFVFQANLTGRGRFSTGFIRVEVNGTTATIEQLSYRQAGGQFGQEDVTATASVAVRAGGCGQYGDLVETTIVTRLENFGPTQIVEQHCVATR